MQSDGLSAGQNLLIGLTFAEGTYVIQSVGNCYDGEAVRFSQVLFV